MATKKSTAVQNYHHRPGEGHTVDVVVIATDNDSVTGALDLSTLPVPDRRFSCDAVGFDVVGGFFKLLFAQKKPVGDELLSMLVINMAPESVVQFLATVKDEFFIPKGKFSPDVDGETTNFSRNADQSVVLSASVIMAGYSGSNGCMDFYYASPFAVQQIATIRKMALESIVRVNVPTGMMFALIKGLKSSSHLLVNRV